MVESSLHNTSSPEITPKEEPVTLDKPKSPNPFLLATHVKFTFVEISFTTNNKVVLIYPSHPNQEYFMDVSDFIFKCCLKEAFTRTLTNKEYLSKFWNTRKNLEDSKTEASKSKTGQSETETKSSLAKDKSPSHPSPPTLVVGKMYKEVQQAVGSPTSLGATSEEGAHPRVSSYFTAEADPGSFDESEEDEADKEETHDTSHDMPEDISEILAELQALSVLVSSVQNQLETLDSFPSRLNKVTETMNRFAIVMENALEAMTKDVPSVGQATASTTEAEKNTKDAETNLKDKLVDLLGTNIMTQYYNKKLLFEKYCNKMLKRKKSPRITNYDVFTKKGPITLKIYREDGFEKVISNLKVTDLHLSK
nr:hypothetical protein [Tanacetum cinerariifolium]